jgi:uncharacterized protein (DUF2225 family)
LAEDKNLKITFIDKNSTTCPVCFNEFYREALMTGSGRLIAGKLTPELRRLYQPSKKFGRINPLIYPIVVCPECLFSAFSEDFSKLNKKYVEQLREFSERRTQLVRQTFGDIDFLENRDDRAGAASYLLAISCYSFFDAGASPTVKRGLCALRAAWLLDDLIQITTDEDTKARYTHVQEIMYAKANQFYFASLDLMQTGKESTEKVALGPDVDKNWGYEGYLYTISFLALKMGYLTEDPEARAIGYVKAKRVISKLFGSGKASKSKPSEILDMSRELYDQLNSRVTEIEETLGKKFD